MGVGGVLLQLGSLVLPFETGQVLPPESGDVFVALPVIGSALYLFAIYGRELAVPSDRGS